MITKEASKHSIRDFEVRSGGWYRPNRISNAAPTT